MRTSRFDWSVCVVKNCRLIAAMWFYSCAPEMTTAEPCLDLALLRVSKLFFHV